MEGFMNTEMNSVSTEEKQLKHINLIAAVSSIIPGLGHIYKGHVKTGVGILIISPFFIWAALLFGFATLGIGLFLPFAYLFVVGWHAYFIENQRKHPLQFF